MDKAAIVYARGQVKAVPIADPTKSSNNRGLHNFKSLCGHLITP